jgi:hypothetical protein
MAILQTTEHFRQAIAYLQSTNHFGGAILQVNIGDTVAECEVLDDETLTILTPDTATLESALDGANATIATTQAEVTQANSAKTALQNLMTGLEGLSAEDKGYAIYCRLMAYRNNATQQVIFGIVDRATAAAYVTSLPQWTNVPATSKPMMQLMLETNAALTQVLLLVLSG